MWGENHIVQLTKRTIGRKWLVGKDIKTSTSQTTATQGIDQRIFIDHPTTTNIDEIGIRLHQCQFRRSNHALGLGGVWYRKTDVVALAEQIVQGSLTHTDTTLDFFTEWSTLSIGDLHTHHVRSPCELIPNLTHAHNTKALPIHFVQAHVAHPVKCHLPLCCLLRTESTEAVRTLGNTLMADQEILTQGKDHRHREFSDTVWALTSYCPKRQPTLSYRISINIGIVATELDQRTQIG